MILMDNDPSTTRFTWAGFPSSLFVCGQARAPLVQTSPLPDETVSRTGCIKMPASGPRGGAQCSQMGFAAWRGGSKSPTVAPCLPDGFMILSLPLGVQRNLLSRSHERYGGSRRQTSK